MAGKKSIKPNAIVETHSDTTTITPLLADLRQLIVSARERVAVAVNAELTMLYWHVGQRIRTEVLKEQRAEYGQQVVNTVADGLTADFGRGFSRPNLFRMLLFAELLTDETIVSTLSRQLSWSHFIEILPLRDDLAQKFYAEMCRLERWSVRTLRERINSMLYERTAISRKPEETIAQELSALSDADRLTPDLVFRDCWRCATRRIGGDRLGNKAIVSMLLTQFSWRHFPEDVNPSYFRYHQPWLCTISSKSSSKSATTTDSMPRA